MVIKVVKLIDSNQYIFENKPYGPVDVRTSESETKEENHAALESLNSFNYSIDGKNILRLVTIIEGSTPKRAIIDSELIFEETIDLLKRQFITRIKECDGAGYLVDMDTGKTRPFLKPHEQKNPFFNQIFQISLGPYSPMFSEQMFSSNRNVEAIEAFIRSIHWYNNSNSQARIYLKFLYKWIAIETIAKTSFDEDIIPKLCLVLGFPLSKHKKSIQRQDIEKWTSVMEYKYYKNIIKKELYKCKKIRNDIVHSGFKETNLINENMELKLYIIDSAYSCMTNTIEKIIMSGRNTIKDVWDVMCEYVMQDENLMHWISGTFFNQVSVFVADSGAMHDDELFQ
jgi:hypothetical protein